ncbi:unnamed protein product [Adineta ricciae]|uniref:Uncharacterized protein n=1 Tax=Adineta ricciae TaxID=249248 RepID=A0A815TPI3_ADIRI|nr:unnamed protein product [Adineta ricciae]
MVNRTSKRQINLKYKRVSRSFAKINHFKQILTSISANIENSSGDEEKNFRDYIDQPVQDALSMNYSTFNGASPNTRKESVAESHFDECSESDEGHKLDEHEINIEDLIDEIDIDDFNRKTPLYSGSPVSAYEACVTLINLTQLLNLDKTKTQLLLKEIRSFFPVDCHLPKTIYKLFEITGNTNIPQVSLHCVNCGALLAKSNKEECSSNCIYNGQYRSSKKIAELAIMNIEYEIRRVVERYVDLINDYSTHGKQLVPCDLINGKVYQSLSSYSNHPNITIVLHGDGAPVVTVSKKSVWPIQATIVEIPVPVRDWKSAVMVFGVWLAATNR